MKISQEVRDYANEHGLTGDADSVMTGMQEQAEKFKREGSQLYQEV